MPRITALDPTKATGKTKELLDAVKSNLGSIPNLMRTLAQAPEALEAFLGLNAALSGGTLGAPFREQIALAVAQANSCEYCLAAHTALGGLVGLTSDEIAASRASRAADRKRDAGLKFAQAIVVQRGEVSDATVSAVRAAGYSDREIVEIVANVVLNIFTNYVNHVAGTEVDFPRVDVALAATA